MPALSGHEYSDRMNAVDVLNILTVVLLTIVTAFFRRELGDQALWLLGILTSLVLFVMLSVYLADRRFWHVVHDFSSVILIIVVFNAIGPVIEHASPARWDVTFMAADQRAFGNLGPMWRHVLRRAAWFTDLNYIAYCGYYVAPVALGVRFYLRDPVRFRIFVFTVVLTFYLSYVGYFMFPTVGPRPPLTAEGILIGGGDISHAIRHFINFAERNHTDAFPSGHTAGALVCLYFAWLTSPVAFAILVPVAAGIIFSTVYLRYHYIIDVVAGSVLACACIWLGPRLEPWLEPREVRKWLTVHLGIR